MNYLFAKEVGVLAYVLKRILWRGWRLLPGPCVSLTLPNGVVLPTPKSSHCGGDVFVSGGTLDWGSEWMLAAYLRRRRGAFVDVGANIGYYSALLSPYAAKCYAFDPDPRNAALLTALAQRLPAMEFCPAAVSDRDGTAELTLGAVSDVSALGVHGAHTTSVPCVSLSSFFRERPDVVAAIKIDIEGCDLLALRGARDVVLRDRPVILTEFNLEAGKPNALPDLFALAREWRLDLYAIMRRDPSPWRCEYSFRALGPDLMTSERPSPDRYRMLFVVPHEDGVFRALADAVPARWAHSILRFRPLRRWNAGWPNRA